MVQGVYLFTKSNTWGSKLIRLMTGDTVSHVAILKDGLVYHSTLENGAIVESYTSFMKNRTLVKSVHHKIADMNSILSHIDSGAFYDVLAIAYWGVVLGWSRITNSKLPKNSKFQNSSYFICTEFALLSLGLDPTLMLTVGQLMRSMEKGELCCD